jgi:hypothetical protein
MSTYLVRGPQVSIDIIRHEVEPEGLTNWTSSKIVPCKRKISEQSVSPTDTRSRDEPNCKISSLHTLPSIDNAKLYVCDTCQTSFTTEEHLEGHARSHPKETSFDCLEGSSSFASQDLPKLFAHQQEFYANNNLSNLSLGCDADLSHLSDIQICEKMNDILSAKENISSSAGLQDNGYWTKGFDGRMSFGTPDHARSGSIHSGASTGLHHQDFTFDSNSVYSGSQASVMSAASGRRGPLNDWARAGMNAVKKVGACWRCKFLRKTVSINFCELRNLNRIDNI